MQLISKRKHRQNYFIMLLVIMNSLNSTISFANNLSFLTLSTLVLILFTYDRKISVITSSLSKIVLFLAVLFILYILKQWDVNPLFMFTTSFRIFLAYLAIRLLNRDGFLYYFKEIVYYGALISIPFYLIQLIDFNLVFEAISSIQNSIPLLQTDFDSFSNIIFWGIRLDSEFRNSGFMWEPGAFAAMLLFPIYIQLLINNYKINRKIASEISKKFFEVILAKGFDSTSLEILKKRKNLRIIDITKYHSKSMTTVKSFDGSFLLQNKDKIIFDVKKMRCVTKLKPNKKELSEIKFAFKMCKYVKSNAIVLCNNFSTIGVGAGQPSRLDSCRIAVQKAKKFSPRQIKNSIAASDAFFPFKDGVETLIRAGVKIIVQPGGSVKDQDVINAANKAKIKMLFTGIRHFNH